MLVMDRNVPWRKNMTNNELYGKIPKVTANIAKRRQLADQCMYNQEDINFSLRYRTWICD